MALKSNNAVPKTFLFVAANPTPESSTNATRWVPMVANEDGVITVEAQATPRPGVSVFTDVNVTSAQPNRTQNDALFAGSNTLLELMCMDVKSFGSVMNQYQTDASKDEGFWNNERGNENPIILPSATYDATQDSSLFTNINARGAHFIINVTDIFGGTPSITVRIQGRDPAKIFSPFVFYDLLVSLAINSVGVNVLKIYPGIQNIPNAAASDILPWQYRVRVEHADAQDIEYSVSANTVV